eukprot:GHRR01016845.1.p2 GENE.GHRR01016845.1~~GHRR01016845.1.p2  ORF type:complete len:113 (+),score=42.07 GHRR01016845.1:400-738(+)
MLAVRIVADKPNYVIPAMQPTEAELVAAHDKLATLANVKHAEQTPSQAYNLPMTGNMEYGFFSACPLVKADPMFQHNKGHCDVTKYAAFYTAMKGVTPFHSSNSSTAGAKAQ